MKKKTTIKKTENQYSSPDATATCYIYIQRNENTIGTQTSQIEHRNTMEF